jgi:hypothetical protein
MYRRARRSTTAEVSFDDMIGDMNSVGAKCRLLSIHLCAYVCVRMHVCVWAEGSGQNCNCIMLA